MLAPSLSLSLSRSIRPPTLAHRDRHTHTPCFAVSAPPTSTSPGQSPSPSPPAGVTSSPLRLAESREGATAKGGDCGSDDGSSRCGRSAVARSLGRFVAQWSRSGPVYVRSPLSAAPHGTHLSRAAVEVCLQLTGERRQHIYHGTLSLSPSLLSLSLSVSLSLRGYFTEAAAAALASQLAHSTQHRD